MLQTSKLVALAGGVLGIAAVGYLYRKNLKGAFDKTFTGAFPKNEGAKSAVTGGHPEDMNEMPATENPGIEGPIYDGSQLKEAR
jgi:hypothetical protein